MAECCIIGCDNKAEKRGGIKFYLLPTAKSSRPAKVKRRQLWLDAIEKANGTAEGLSRNDTQICSAHFVSGQMSLDISDQDFVPSVFPKQHTAKSRRQTLRPRSGALAETPKVTPKKISERKPANAPEKVEKSNNIFLPENNYCEPLEDDDILEEEAITQPPSCQVIIEQQQTNVLKEEETTQPPSCQVIIEQQQISVLKEEETTQPPSCQVIIEQQQISVLKEEETTQPPSCQVIIEQQQQINVLKEGETTQPPSSRVKIEQQQIFDYVNLKKPKLHIKPIVDRFRQFRCEVCNGKFATASGLLKHRQLHEQEWSDEDEILPTVSVVKSELIEKNVTVEEPSFQCNMCDRSFPAIHSLKRHKLLHVRDSRKCTQCGTMFCKRHNYVIAQPQISTETNFEETETTSNDMDETAECPKLCLSDGDSDGVDEGLELLLNSNSLALDAIAAAQEQTEPLAENQPKEAPTITYNPRKPGLLIAFKSFLNKHRPESLKIKKKRHGILRLPTGKALLAAATSTNTNAAGLITTITAPITPAAVPITTTTAPDAPITTSTAVSSITAPISTTTAAVSITAPITTTTAISSIIAPITTTTAVSSRTAPIPITTTTIAAAAPIITASTMGVTAKPVPETSSKTYSLTTTSNALTPQLGKSVVYVARSQHQGPGQKMEQSTVCLSFSKPIPTNVIQEFMTYISKTEAMKSEAPQLVTFTAKQDQIIAKQETNKMASILKLKPTHTPLQDVPEEPDNEKTTFIITSLSKSNVKPPPVILPKVNSQTTSEIKSQNQKVEFRTPTVTAKKVKASPKVQVPYKRPYVHGSRPPTPEPIFAKIKKGPWDSPIPNYPKDFIQPHLPQTPKLPLELQMFSPQFLTSAMLDVERNFEYILSE